MRVNGAADRDRQPAPASLQGGDLFGRLPAWAQQRLRAVGDDARTIFGGLRDAQTIVQRHIDFFEGLLADGGRYDILAALLAHVGIARPDGSPLPVGTLSSAVSRARGRVPVPPARPGRVHPELVEAVPVMPDTAAPCSALHCPAHHCNDMQKPATPGAERRDAADPGIALHSPAESGSALHRPAVHVRPPHDLAAARHLRPDAAGRSVPPPPQARRNDDETGSTPAPPATPIATAAPPAMAPSPTLARPTASPAASTGIPPAGADAADATARAARLLNMLRSTSDEQ